MDYLNIPVMAKVNLGPLFLQGGVQFGFLVGKPEISYTMGNLSNSQKLDKDAYDVVVVFLQEYQDYPWFGTVKEIVLDRRAGAELYRLTLVRGKQKFELLIQRSKYGSLDRKSVV